MSLPGAVIEAEDQQSQFNDSLSCAVNYSNSVLGLDRDKFSAVFGDEQVPSRRFHVPWRVRIGGFFLALCAGGVNAVALHSLGHFVGNHTGTWAKVGLGLQDGDQWNAGSSVILVMAFVMGGTLSGILLGGKGLHLSLTPYDLALLSVAGLLVAACFLSDSKACGYLAALACGMQNGMTTIWGGSCVRTTHVTGLWTDVGLLLANILSMLARKRCGSRFNATDRVEMADDVSKLSILLTVAFAFFLGVFFGAHLHNAIAKHAFLVAAGVIGSAGLAHLVYRVFFLGRHLSGMERKVSESSAHILDPVLPVVNEGGAEPLPGSWADAAQSPTPSEDASDVPRTGSKSSQDRSMSLASAHSNSAQRQASAAAI